MILGYTLLLVMGLGLLLKSADLSIKLIEKIGLKVKIPTLILSSIFLALATSFPEFSVGLVSALNHQPLLSLGNILGANLANLTLILGLTTIISGGVKVKDKVLYKDVFVTFLIASLPYLLILDRTVSQVDGLILIIIYFVYNLFLIREEKKQLEKEKSQEIGKMRKLLGKLLLWLALLAISAEIVVTSSEKVSAMINLPLALIGIFILAFGTTIPEMIVQLKSAESREEGIFFGNIFGSIVVNSSLILGIVALISPVKILETRHFWSSGLFTLVAFALLPIFLKSKNKLERNEGVILLSLYLVFLLAGFILIR